MIVLLGANGHIGQGFSRELRGRGETLIPLTQEGLDFSRFEVLFDYLRRVKPDLLINAASYPAFPLEGGCEFEGIETLRPEPVSPQTVAKACLLTKTPWAHVASGSVYSGAKIFDNAKLRIVTDVTRPEVLSAYAAHPDNFLGFTEKDAPNFKPQNGQAAALNLGATQDTAYIWRFRMTFSEDWEPWNLLWQLHHASHVHDAINSVSHLGDCVRACLDLWERRAPYGVYNVTNPEPVTHQQILSELHRTAKPRPRGRCPIGSEIVQPLSPPVRSNCILDVSKLLWTGVKIRPAMEALRHALKHAPKTGATNITRVIFSK